MTLGSRNHGAAKPAIVGFVARVTKCYWSNVLGSSERVPT